MDLSVIIPIHNERENIPIVHDELIAALRPLGRRWELVFIDDGSTDGSGAILQALADADQRVTLVSLRRNFGQTAAMQAGLEAARGEVLITIDGDLQNDPADIPRLLAQIDAGFDCVHGWRRDRHDALLTRKIPSWLANALISRVTRFPIHDLGCTLKAMRREIADELELYGEMHRFIPILAYARGARCCELVVHHRPRRFGTSKYGLSRAGRVVLDLLTVKYLLDYFDRPMKLFGRFGLCACATSAVAAMLVLAMKLAGQVDMTGNPLLLLSVLSAIVGVQFFSLGLLGEVSARLYYQRDQRRPFAIRRVTRGASAAPSRRAA